MSSNNIAIKVEGISKRYRIGLKEQRHDSVGGALVGFIKNPIKNYRKYRCLYSFDDLEGKSNSDSLDIVWALRGVSFTVERGEAFGIIGGNGAGKSTLLKILSRITDPTAGEAEIRGKVSSLLEVGTGFHPELTGRENVYLNATILGMRKTEVDHKFDEIVDFSGIERFIDTPVKRYSTGMKVRLAFSVAAHLEPEILLIDEVLAVGDAAFQEKCLGKMGNVTKEGRTVLFVSHNMGAITRLCEKALWLEQGQRKFSGFSSDVVSSYLSSRTTTSATWTRPSNCSDDVEIQINSVRLLSDDDHLYSNLHFDNRFKIEIAYVLKDSIMNLSILHQIVDLMGNIVWSSWDTDTTDWNGRVREPGMYLSTCSIPERLLRPGCYKLTVGAIVKNVKLFELFENILSFDITEVGYNMNSWRKGIITPLLHWEVEKIGHIGTVLQPDR